MKTLLSVLFCLPFLLFAQKKEYDITRVTTAPIIDGFLNDDAWLNTSSTSNFYSYVPQSGQSISNELQTHWKAVYDNKAIYFAIYMYDAFPDSIMTQYCKRDGIDGSNNDYVSIMINPYMDGQTDFIFMLTPQGIQQDEKASLEYYDSNWDMVWYGACSKDDKGWYAEYKIPYSALRFPNRKIQDWSFNIKRHVRRYRETHTWNKMDLTNKNISSQAGILKNLKDLSPPLRLSFLPYISSYANHYKNVTDLNLNGGMDLKYGLNESFTLDMTLIPDFGQVGFDNQVLNLSPFEIQYDEKRPFFTEGTELFSKSGLFYSRRISDNLINASKITGKTKHQLGIGVLNAITGHTDSNPLSNYNIITLDQSLKNSSYLSITNTNVYRKNKDYANVTGLKIALRNPSKTFQLSSTFNYSIREQNTSQSSGFASYSEFSKISGVFQYYVSNILESDSYNPNDMGFLYNNNELSNYAGISYRLAKPTHKLVEFNASINTSYNRLFNPRLFVSWEMDARQVCTFKNYLSWGLTSEVNLKESNDYFEARSSLDQLFKRSESYVLRTFFSSDYRKKIALDISFGGGQAPLYDEKKHFFRFSPRIRFSDKLFMYYVFSTQTTDRESGYIATEQNRSIFSIRNKQFFTNVLSGQFVLNTKMSFDLKFRHHWEQVVNDSFHELNSEGYLVNSSYSGDKNVNFNAWNIDINFNYWFAPGSELSVVWKNSILSSGTQVQTYYRDNLQALLNNPQENSLSLKLRYYLDYQYFKKK